MLDLEAVESVWFFLRNSNGELLLTLSSSDGLNRPEKEDMSPLSS